ncbi:ribonuclease domain-containing protein [Kribbella solani]|uniref:ribonuclease domain-containing protein n=1 Tax=Kribbella solani TaxID=236067 RepID=UPI0029AAA6CC|nr:ribonuclease domain-containing protein [Kribbella solani]MDX2973371.1 ribonuclease domain-containing protein [Kribbella solani]
MRTLIAAVTLATTVAFGSTAYAAPTAHPTSSSITAIDTCALSSLPSQASDTLKLIHSGGPFPYRQDGTVFSNREGILPSQSSGYYHEYTVKTSGSPDRGARRLIGGGAKTTPAHLYYTGDHYASFCEVDENS